MAIRLSYATARVLLAGHVEAKDEEHRRAVRTRGLKRSSTFRNYIHSEPRFRALLTEGEAWVLFYDDGFSWLGKNLK